MADDPQDDVRARLAAEPTPPMPDDVAARLHDALAAESGARIATDGSSSGPDVSPSTGTVTRLPRRGRWKAPLLAAAAIVAIVAIGIPVINQSSDRSGDDGGSASTAGASREFNNAQTPQSTDPDQSAPKDQNRSMVEHFRREPMDLHRVSFAEDVQGYLGSRSARSSLSVSDDPTVRCEGNRPVSPDGLQATLDGDPAVVVVSPAGSGGKLVRALVCGGNGPGVAARTTLE